MSHDLLFSSISRFSLNLVIAAICLLTLGLSAPALSWAQAAPDSSNTSQTANTLSPQIHSIEQNMHKINQLPPKAVGWNNYIIIMLLICACVLFLIFIAVGIVVYSKFRNFEQHAEQKLLQARNLVNQARQQSAGGMTTELVSRLQAIPPSEQYNEQIINAARVILQIEQGFPFAAALVAQSNKEWTTAVVMWSLVLSVQKHNPVALFGMGFCTQSLAETTDNQAHRLDMRQQAIAFYQELLQINPQIAEAWFNLGKILEEWSSELDDSGHKAELLKQARESQARAKSLMENIA